MQKTGRVIIIDDSNRTCGFASEVAAFLSDQCFDFLKTPIKRITRADVPVPFSPILEKQVLPGEVQLIDEIYRILKK